MDVNVRTENGHSVVSLAGRLDAVTAPACEQKFRELITAEGLSLVVDLDGVEYISSAGLRVLLVVAKLLREKNGRLCLANVRRNVLTVFEISGFTNIFKIRESVQEALAAIS